MDIKKLKARLAELVKDRDDLVQEANREIAYRNGRIAEIEKLISDTQAGAEQDEKKD